MGLLLVTPPPIEPVTLAEAKSHCRVDADLTADDSLLSSFIVAAREIAEQQCERSFILTAWQYTINFFPREIRVPRAPLIAIQSIQYVDNAGVLQTLDPGEYQATIGGEVTRIHNAYQKNWPTTRVEPDAVRINFTAGYGSTAASVPLAIRQAILLMVNHWYEHRGEDAMMADMPKAAENLLRRYWPGNYS